MEAGAEQRNPSAELNAELQAAALRALLERWHGFNHTLFRGALTPPQLLFTDATHVLGRWVATKRCLEISRRLVLEHPWGIVVEVLKHEMAHQYTDEALGARQTAHGEAFRQVCTRLGIDATATGLPRAAAPLGDSEAKLRRRIAKLLALAESPHVGEAESAMREAQRLMWKYNLEVVASSAHPPYGFRHLGEPTRRLQAHQHFIGSILCKFFFVEAIWVPIYRPREGTHGTVLEICGTEANLELAAYVHDFLVTSAERLWREHKRERKIRADRDRRSYLCGVMRGFFDKLAAQQDQHRATGLVWVKDQDLAHYLRQRHPRRQSARSTSRAHAAAFGHGQRAGGDLVLHKPITGGASSGGRLLAARRS